MKAGPFMIAGISMLKHFTMAHIHDHSHRQQAKRAQVVITDVVTDVEYVSYESEDLIIYVDDNDNPVSTSTVYKNRIGGPTPGPSTNSVALAVEKAASPILSSEPMINPTQESSTVLSPSNSQSTEAAAESKSTAQSGTSSPPGKADSGPGFGSGIAYSPYDENNNCKTASQVATDFEKINGYAVIRLYGTDCNQVANVLAATKRQVKIFAGLFDLNNIKDEAQIIADAVNHDWSLINTVSVGNELVNNGGATVSQVVSGINTARTVLKALGYSGAVVTVDTMVAMKNNIALCEASDMCCINSHAFFDGNILPTDAGPFVSKWAKEISDAAGGKTTVITESGWPTQGDTNKRAVPSPENQQIAIDSLKKTFPENLVLYSAYNTLWKKDGASTFNAEKYWGLLGNSPSS